MTEPDRTVGSNATINAATGEITYPCTWVPPYAVPCSSYGHPHAGPCGISGRR